MPLTSPAGDEDLEMILLHVVHFRSVMESPLTQCWRGFQELPHPQPHVAFTRCLTWG